MVKNNEAKKENIKLLKLPDIYKMKVILCVQPHHDDNDIGAGALICDLVKNKIDVIYLTVTNGDMGIKDISLTNIQKTEIRRNEQTNSGKISGVKQFIDLGYPDSGKYTTDDLESELIKIIKLYNADILIGPDPSLEYEAHTDHIKTGKALIRAAFKCNIGVAMYYTSKPNIFFDSKNNWDIKKKMIMEFKSQFNPEYLDEIFEYMDYMARIHGKKIGKEYAEGLKVLPPHGLHCIPFD